ncbi:Rad4p [Lachancea thermotolerans CBS 6340]|uniref:KLTH0G14564p n=1 Tax=Lachancea thermotolerans (strain ATCC 56472 / CBS 6340 / NRRL Y-8284) TaxID=559295 RepID=C5DN67_LACTC|nr:KLTH0G14564p [Lachancea thermotolerans CBS 6340]CAR25228.1 KLTH0G14564p [Lachancea thermotolerans CBS 6340]
MGQLPEEYFDLVREAVREDKRVPARKKRRLLRYDTKDVTGPANVVITLDSESEHENRERSSSPKGGISGSSTSEGDFAEDDDFNSDDFEDVTDLEGPEQTPQADVSITLNTSKKESKPRSKNLISNEDRKFRRYFHMFHLLALLVHAHIRNQWLNDHKLHAKLSKLVPDDVFEMLHPKKDNELPLRSTRKLLDGLKKCMEIWWKHFDQITRWETPGMNMIEWKELDGPWEQPARFMSQKLFSKKVAHGKGSSDVAAQGFVAMLRACGVNARLIINAQPPDFTDNKVSMPGNVKHAGEYLEDSSSRPLPRRRQNKKEKDSDAKRYSIFWCEVWDKASKKWITVDPMGQRIIEQIRYKTTLEPQGKARRNNLFRYIIAFDRKQGCRDVTRRYTTHFNSKTRRRRITRDLEGEEWFRRILAKLHRRKRTRTDDFEDAYFQQRDETEGIPDNMQDLKNHPYYVLQNDLKWNEVLKSGCKECGFLRTKNNTSSLKVFRRSDVLVLKTARTWYTEGRVLKTGAAALKTTNSRDFRTGETTEERLYSFDQTELFVPENLGPNNEVPTNVYGNIDVYAPNMIPQGSCLIESPVAVKAAALLGIEFAKAVTGFKFEKRSAKPQFTGIVVAQEYQEAVESMIDGVEYSQEEDKRREHELESLQYWNLFLAKLRIKQRLNKTHGKVISGDQHAESGHSAGELGGNNDVEVAEDDSFEAGGFMPEADGNMPDAGGFIPDAEGNISEAGGFVAEASELPAEAGTFGFESNELVSGVDDPSNGGEGFLPEENEMAEGCNEIGGDDLEVSTNFNRSLPRSSEFDAGLSRVENEQKPTSDGMDDDYEEFMKDINFEDEQGLSAQDDSDFSYESE